MEVDKELQNFYEMEYIGLWDGISYSKNEQKHKELIDQGYDEVFWF